MKHLFLIAFVATASLVFAHGSHHHGSRSDRGSQHAERGHYGHGKHQAGRPGQGHGHQHQAGRPGQGHGHQHQAGRPGQGHGQQHQAGRPGQGHGQQHQAGRPGQGHGQQHQAGRPGQGHGQQHQAGRPGQGHGQQHQAGRPGQGHGQQHQAGRPAQGNNHKPADKPEHGKHQDVSPGGHTDRNTPHKGDGPANVDLSDLRKKGVIDKGQDVGDAGLNTSNQNASDRWNAKNRR